MRSEAGASVPRAELAPGYSIARVIQGGWQLTPDHSDREIDRTAQIDSFLRTAEAGFTTLDCADIYTGVEKLFGEFLRAWRAGGRDTDRIQIHTKYVPDLAALATLTRADVARAVDRSLARLGVERLDLVQFHWWDHGVPGFLETAGWLSDLVPTGKLRSIGLTNVATADMRELTASGINVRANQVQYSLLDRRPEHGLNSLCAKTGARLLCYGALAGGFLSEGYLRTPVPHEPLSNRSLVKYRLIVEEYGGWKAFQNLLDTVAQIARKHEVSLANVAARWVLERSGVAAVILGASRSDRLVENLRLFSFELDPDDRRALERHCNGHPGPEGDIYERERDRSGPHWAILRTGLHQG